MSNAPDHFAAVVLPDGVQKYAYLAAGARPPHPPAFFYGHAPAGITEEWAGGRGVGWSVCTAAAGRCLGFWRTALTLWLRFLPSPSLLSASAVRIHTLLLPPLGTPLPPSPPLVLPRLTYERDVKVENAGTLTIEREDHTLGNLMRMQLLRDPRVTYVAYKQPHPLEHHIILRVHTQLGPRGGVGGGGVGDAAVGGGAGGGGDAAAPYLPTDAIATALRDLNAEINLIADRLGEALDAAATTMDDHGQYR